VRYKCTISVANSYLRIHGYAEEFARKILLPFCHHHLFKFGMIPSESNPMIQTYGVTHRFARFNKDKTELRITSTLLPDLKNFITQRGYSDNDILIDDEPLIEPIKVELKFKVGFDQPNKPEQYDWMPYLTDDGPLKLNNAATGVGKGWLDLYAAVAAGERVVIIGNARFLPIWNVECGKFLDLQPKDYHVADAGGLDVLMDQLKSGVINPKILVISLSKIDVMVRKSRLDETYPTLDDVYKLFRPGLRIYDEVHESIHQVYLSLMFGNIKKTIGNTATFKAEDPFTNKIYKYLFPESVRLKDTVYTAHMHIKAIHYRINTRQNKIRTTARGVYNDTTFEASIMDNKKLRPHYIELMLWCFREYYLNRRKPESKCLFFFTKVETCKFMVEELKKRYPELDAISFTGEQGGKADTKDEYRKHEIVFSTPGSCGTGKDIPGLITCISFHNVKSVQRNYQMRGRVRENKNPLHNGVDLIFGYTVCDDVDKHVSYHHYRKELFEESSLSYQNVDSGIFMY